jgi:hypothetical protein
LFSLIRSCEYVSFVVVTESNFSTETGRLNAFAIDFAFQGFYRREARNAADNCDPSSAIGARNPLRISNSISNHRLNPASGQEKPAFSGRFHMVTHSLFETGGRCTAHRVQQVIDERLFDIFDTYPGAETVPDGQLG